MQVAKYLQTKQPIIYRTFVRSLENRHLSHAYLISGNPGTLPLCHGVVSELDFCVILLNHVR